MSDEVLPSATYGFSLKLEVPDFLGDPGDLIDTILDRADDALDSVIDGGKAIQDELADLDGDDIVDAIEDIVDDLLGEDGKDWLAALADGFSGAFGAGGTVQGTLGIQDITVLDLAGAITFDASFNRGDDIIRLSGEAADWRALLSGSTAQLSNGVTTVTIPAGSAGLTLVFDDGTRELRFEGGEVRIGGQALGDVFEYLTAPASGAAPSLAGDLDALGQLFLPVSGHVAAAGNLTVYGTAGDEEVSLSGKGKITLDASFNGGGDTLVLSGEASFYSALRVGSSVVLSSADGEVTIPVGTKGLTLDFADGDRTLVYDSVLAAVTLGGQTIASVQVGLTDFA